MDDALTPDNVHSAPDRRAFFGRVTTTALTVAAAGIPLHAIDAQQSSDMHPPAQPPWNDAWLDRIKGKHRQFFDAVTPNDGFGLAFAMNFLNLYNEVYHISDQDLTAVLGIRHFATPLAFDDHIWAKYELGTFFKVQDPATKAPATRNIFTREETVLVPSSSIGKLQARGVVLTMCNVALTILSGMTAKAAGLPEKPAKEEWVAGLLPGVILVPVGVMAVNRAQEKGCTYCYAG